MPDFFSQTLKGKAEMAVRPGKLGTGLRTLLGLVGEGASFPDLKTRLPQVPESKLNAALDALVRDGYLQRTSVAADPADNDLDFTRFISRPVKEPTLQQKQLAEATLAGIRSSGRAGFHVKAIDRPAAPIKPHAGGDRHTALILEADDGHALVVTRALLLARFNTRAAGKRAEIIAELNRKPPPDIVVMELALPEVGGLELLNRLRQHPVYKDIPVLVMAKTQKREDVVQALANGASGFLSKPFKPEQVVEGVRALLGI